ncbi:MAG: phosphoribosylaminoimidazolesuccinocarboxamide synthase [Candidatus Pacebacteria bacterium]|nr:phosphoribosylaminoimidazolesuccinocarboxamide synthase [Candidatus Paceibacterota bacterium]
MGKTKTVQNKDGLINILFRDDVTGTNGVMDSGGNEVVGKMADKARASLSVSTYFFKKLETLGVSTHYVSTDANLLTMIAERAEIFGNGLEFICRRRACGSFVRRYGDYIQEMEKLPHLVEVTIKDDERGDPLINDDAVVALGIMSLKELNEAKELTRRIAQIIELDLGEKGLKLIDLKLEFGKINGKIVLIDEISGDCMRVKKGGVLLNQIELYEVLIAED